MQVLISGLTPVNAFRALVEPALLVRWWPPEAEVDAREGGAYCLRWPQQGWLLRGRFLVLAPPERLEFTWRWDHEPELPERTVCKAWRQYGWNTGARSLCEPLAALAAHAVGLSADDVVAGRVISVVEPPAWPRPRDRFPFLYAPGVDNAASPGR